jgi:uncharacterized pyridoxal phosphate-containing UPF0001 family protein
LAVTKYWDLEETEKFIWELSLDEKNILVWFWENRIESFFEKKLKREETHFIGNIQSKDIKHIVKFCDTVHSIDNLKHVKKLEEICNKQDTWIKFFLQINIDKNKDWGIIPEQIPEFLELIDKCDNISLVWFSAIWKAEFNEEEKREEFRLLKKLRGKYLPHWFISAWTSRDYKIALEEEIDIIRVGKSLVL